MRFRFTSNLLATVLAIALATGLAQEQQPGKGQGPPDSNAPQTSAPPTASPQTPPSPDQSTPQPGESNQNVPNTQEQAPPQKEAQPPQPVAPEVNTPAKPKTTSPNSTRSRKHNAKTKTQSKSAHRTKTVTPSSEERGKVVVRNGGASDDVIHLSPGGGQEQNAHNRENTEQLLATTDANLKRMEDRQLSPAQQSTVDQIHSYMRQAKSAANAGDLERAHTLAFKAHLLSDDLAKH